MRDAVCHRLQTLASHLATGQPNLHATNGRFDKPTLGPTLHSFINGRQDRTEIFMLREESHRG